MPPKRRRSAGTRRSRVRAVVPSLSDFSSNAADSRRPESATGRAGRRAIALALVALVGAVAPLLLASGAAATPLTDGAIAGPPTDGGTAASVPTAASATQQTGSALNESEKREAAREGVSRGVELAQLQGVDVTQAQVQAARDGAGMAANQSQTANVSQIQAAVAGATHAALVQSQNVSVEQFQAAVGGATSGSLTQTQNVSVTQLQSASFGAVHGALAEKRRGGARDVRAACEGAAAGAASSGVTAVPVVQEAAQGSAYGAITQRQNVSVEQRQAAAFGAARGVLESGQNVSVAQRQSVDVKKVQTAALGAAKGALTQSQQATVEQVQAAGRGAAKGAIAQYQRVTVEQIQAAAAGAASGGISQYQSASVTQIQAAATGGARGALVRSQSVNVVQIQKAASGSASGAARGAAQSQVVDIEQIQAAATGAAEGGIVQIQVVNIVQIQIVTDSAAEGAVSQSQVANVVQIQNAARGASRGGVGLTQIQTVSITQLQISVTQSASTAAESAANEGVTDGDEISDSAQGDVEDEYVPPSPDVESLEVAVDCESLSVENPNDVAVTVTRVAENGSVDNVTVPAGETRAISVSAMSYALRAETEDGTFVRVDGLVTFVVDVDPCPPPASESLDVTVEGRNVTVENPNDVAVNLTVENASGGVFEGSVPADGNETIPGLEPGDYDLSAERDGEVVLVEGEEVYTVTIQAEDDDDDGDGPDDGDGVDTELSSCTVVDEPGRYTLTGDVSAEVSESGACIEIQSSDVALDGQGYALALTEGGNASGVAVEGSETLSNVTVANLTVEGFNVGVEVRDAEDGAVRNVTVAGTPPEDGQTGIDLSMVSEFVVADSSVQGSADVRTTGIDATQSGDLTISGNDVTPAGGSGTGISFTIVGDSEVTDNDVSDGDTGIQVFNTGGNRVANNTVTEFDVGIYVSEAQDNDFADNRIENSSHGVLINGVSDENSFTDTQVANADTGFDVVDSADIVVEGATIDGADTAVSLTGEGYLGDDPTDYPSGVRLVDVEVTDAVTAIYADNGSTAVAEGLAIGPVAGIALDATNVSVAGSRGVTGEVPGTGALPAFPEGVTPVVDAGNESAPFVGITGTDEDPSVELELPYDDTALPEEVNESALRLWRSNGTTDGAWTLVAGSTVDAGGNLVSGEFAPESGVERAYGPAARTEAEPVAFENLSVAVEGRNVTVENPNDVAVNLTVANESRAVANASVSAGGNATIGPLAPGNYTLTATADGRTVPVEGEDRYAFAIEAPEPGPELDSIQVETDVCAVPVADGGATRQLSVNVTNSNDQDVALVAFFEGEERAVVTVPAGNQTVDLPPEAGNWTFRAYVPADAAEETEFDEPGPYPNLTAVPVNDAESVPVTVELCAIDIGVSQTDGNVTVTNDEPIDATVFVRNDTLQTVPVPAGESVALDSLAPDEYTLTAEAIDGGPAMFDGETSLNVTIEAIGTPTPTPTPNETVTPTPNETVTPTESPTPTPTPTPTESPTQTPTTTATPTESPTDTQVATTAPTTPEPTPTEGPTPTDAPVTTPTETGTPTPTETPTPSPTATPAPTVAPTSTPTATSAPAGTQTTASQQFGVDTSGDSPGVVRATAEAATGLVESVGGLLERASDAIAGAIGSVTPTTDTLDAVVAERTVFGYETMTTWLP